jgi:enoyl-CoA hydratase/carnithine racemase
LKAESKVMTAAPAKPQTVANESILLREDDDGVTVLTLNRPQFRNALSEAMLAALSEALANIAGDHRVRAVVLAANGAAFCSGHDLKELTARRSDLDGGRAFFERLWDACGVVMQAIVRLPQPVIAAVQGPATAAGCELVASCDLAIASTLAAFATPGVDIGLFCSTPMIPLSRNIARKHAMEMLLTGNMISAEDAFRFGIVNRVVAPSAERAAAVTLARQIASKSAMTMQIGKKAFYQQIEMGLTDAYRYGACVMVDNLLKDDANEGIRAFLEKRPAKWKDR